MRPACLGAAHGGKHVHCSITGAYEDSRALRSTSRRRSVSCQVGSAMMVRRGMEERRAQGRMEGSWQEAARVGA